MSISAVALSLPPNALGAPSHYTSWYPHQWKAVQDALDAPTRFVGQCVPTGGGKSLIAIMMATLSGMRTCYLTSTKALQDQVLRDFHTTLTDVRGQQNYECLNVGDRVSVADGPCHIGYKCPMKGGGCLYYDQVKAAARSKVVVTNYAYYMTQLNNEQGAALGKFDLIVCDEGHLVVDEITSFMQFAITRQDCRALEIEMPNPRPVGVDGWIKWASEVMGKMTVHPVSQYNEQMTGTDLKSAVRRSNEVVQADRKIKKLSSILDATNWIICQSDADRIEFSPIWPAKYAERVMYRGADKVMMMSATLTRKAMFLAGVPTDNYTFTEYPSTYPIANRRVTYIPTVAMNRRASDYNISEWVHRIDQILRSRPNRKAIIHTTSYQRMRTLFEASTERHRMIQHGSGQTSQAINMFRSYPPSSGAVLVSPVVHSGYDFKGDECRVVIIGKLPFPDSRDPMVKSRSDRDKEWIPHQVMQTLIQSAGRATRSGDDWSEIMVIDDDFWWFWWKYKYLAPGWFVDSVQKSNTIPEPR